MAHWGAVAQNQRQQTYILLLILDGNPCLKRPIGRPETCWEDDVLENTCIRRMNVRNWKKVAWDRDSWKKAAEQARNLHGL